MHSRYFAAIFLQIAHERQHIAHLWGPDMGCFREFKGWLKFTPVIVVMCALLCYRAESRFVPIQWEMPLVCKPRISPVLYMTVLYRESTVFLIIKLRHLWDRLTIIMGSPILSLYIEMGPCWCHRWQCVNIQNNILNKYGHSLKKASSDSLNFLFPGVTKCVWDIVSYINTLPHV